jgi:hypothetical protein
MTKKHTTGGIPRWSPTLVLVARFSAYVWQSGRDAQFSLTYGRMYREMHLWNIYITIFAQRKRMDIETSSPPQLLQFHNLEQIFEATLATPGISADIHEQSLPSAAHF